MTRTVLRNGLVFDGESTAVAPADVVFEGSTIVDVGPGLEGDVEVDCEGSLVVPGLFDCHVHVTVSDMDAVKAGRQPFSLHYFESARNLGLLLDTGVTSVRDCCGADLGIKRALEMGLIEGPRMQITITMLSQTGGHGDLCLPGGQPMPFPNMMPCPGRPSGIVDGVDAVRHKARELFRAGADVLKIASSGGVMSPGDDPHHAHFRDDELEAFVTEAAAVNSYVLAHAQSTDGIKNAVRAGVRSIEHGFYLDDEAIEMMVSRGTWLVPTLSAARGIFQAAERGIDLPAESIRQMREGADAQKESLRKAADAGVRVAMGTDTPGVPFDQVLDELDFMAEATGWDPLESWRAATSSSADLLRFTDAGRLMPGKAADVVVLGGRLADLKGLRDRIEQVWQRGVRVR